MTLTAEQRYRQAEIKTRMQVARSVRLFLEGRADTVSVVWRERANLIAEIERAYQAGIEDGRQRDG